MLLYSTENRPKMHISISRYSIITTRQQHYLQCNAMPRSYFTPKPTEKNLYLNNKGGKKFNLYKSIFLFCIILIVKYSYTMDVIFIGTIRCQVMCDQLEEAAQQLAFFCEAQKSLGNIAVKLLFLQPTLTLPIAQCSVEALDCLQDMFRSVVINQ